MPNNRRMKVVTAAAAVAAVLIAGCSSSSSAPSSTSGGSPSSNAASPSSSGGSPAGSGNSSAAPGSATAGGTTTTTAPSGSLVIDNVFSLVTADPGRNFEPTGNIVARALYDSLVTYKGADLKTPVPDIASSWETSSDKLTYTFHLNTKAAFSDGTPVTSADVLFSLQRVANVKGNPSFLVAGMKFAAPDPETFTVTTTAYDPAVLAKLANPSLGIVNSKAVKAVGGSDGPDAATADKAEPAFDKQSYGSGPYILGTFGLTTAVTFVPNPKYWGGPGRAAFTKVVLQNVAASQQANDVAKGVAQLALDLSPDQAAGISGGGSVTNSVASQYTFYLFTNANPAVSKWTSNPDFQNAVRQGIDYNGLLALAGKGSQRAPGMIPVQFAGALPASDAPKFDLAAAKASLAKSGYDGTPIQVSYPSDLTQNGVSFTDMATRIGNDLNTVGIKTTLSGAPTTVVLQLARSGKQQIGVWLWGPDYPDASDYLVFGPGGSVGGKRVNWQTGSDPAIEATMKAAQSETDPAKRVAAYQKFQQELNQGPVMSLIQPAQVFVASSKLKGLSYNLVWTVDIGELS